jgi:diguanylate cyclase (GGDEF)-like protein/PAS domain S-box-containing protein
VFRSLFKKKWRLSILAIWATLVLLALHVYVDLRRSYDDARDRGVRLATSYVRLVAEHAADTFDRADLMLEQAAQLATPADLAQARALPYARRETMERALVALQAKAPAIVSMSMTDAEGYVFANSVGTPPGGNLGDRSYFLELKGSGGPGPVVSEVVKGRVSNKWGIQVARRIRSASGGFGGMVVANVGMTSYMEGFYGGLALAPSSVVSLRDMQHRLLVRHPVSPDLFGKIIPSGEITQLFRSGTDEGWVERVSPIDGMHRIVAVKKLARYDIYALVGIAEEEFLGGWMKSRDQAVVLLALALLVAVVATFLSSWKSRLDSQLGAQVSFLDALLNTLPIPIFARNVAGQFVICNRAYERFFGIRREEVIGRTVFDIFPKDLAASYQEADRKVLDDQGSATYEAGVIRGDGVPRRVVIDKARYGGADGKTAGIVATVVDITDREAMERELRRLATTDPLTGVGNRRHFLNVAELEMARLNRHFRPLSVIVFDIDMFKQINDGFGHGVGDDAIRAVADTCTAILRDIDVIGRTGGEEFSILLPESDLDAAKEVARRLHESIRNLKIRSDKGPVSFTASFGVTQVRETDSDIDAALRRADAALHEAKGKGRDCVIVRD